MANVEDVLKKLNTLAVSIEDSEEKPDAVYTWSGDLLIKKVATYPDRTETTDYTWLLDKLVKKDVTIS